MFCKSEIYCEKCFNIIDEDPCCAQPKPCRVVSSPSLICVPKSSGIVLPNAGCRKFYKICFRDDGKVKSCSAIPDIKKAYCFPCPIPTEVANYLNRNMGKKCQTNNTNCCEGCYSKCCSRNYKTHVKVRKMCPPTTCQSPPKCKQNCQESCKCQGCNAHIPPSTCCPSPPTCCASPHTCGTSPPTCRPSPPTCCSPTPKCCKPVLKCSSRTKLCCCSCSSPEPCPYSKQKSEKCPKSPTIFCTVPKQEQCPSIRKPCQPIKCCCDSCCPKDCPKMKPCYKDCCSSPTRYCPPPRTSPCNTNCLTNNCPKCSCSSDQSYCCYSKKMPKYCCCGNLNPCKCKMGQVRALCQSFCLRCGQKVYAAEKIIVTNGSYHSSCFSCYCCHKLLDVRHVQEHCNEIYCRTCYNKFFGLQYYGYGSS